MPAQPLTFGPFRLDPGNGTLFKNGELVAVGQKGALLLGALLKLPVDVLTKAQLMDATWPGMAVDCRTTTASAPFLPGELPSSSYVLSTSDSGYELAEKKTRLCCCAAGSII